MRHKPQVVGGWLLGASTVKVDKNSAEPQAIQRKTHFRGGPNERLVSLDGLFERVAR